jgi:hypothetical protein
MSLRFRVFAVVIAVFGLLSVSIFPALAQTVENVESVAVTSGFGTSDLLTIIGNVIKVFLGLLGIIFLVLVIYAGYLWMTAGGDDKRVDRAKKMLINAVVGIVIILFSYGITSFLMNAFLDATGGRNGGPGNGTVSVESLSGSLGSGAIQDHFPLRNQTDVDRNANIMVTFRAAMETASFVTEDGTVNTDNVQIYRSVDGDDGALANVDVYFSEDLRTVVFNPQEYLGSATEDVSYTVFLDTGIQDAEGNKIFTGLNDGGYEWTFTTGVNLDLEPPTVVSVTPVAQGTYAKNIIVQMQFSEAIDPTSSTGTRFLNEAGIQEGFSNIQVSGTDGLVLGTYEISNGYKTITFETTTLCGTNSCGQDIYCLPGGQLISSTIFAATPGATPPAVDIFPYDGIVDTAANSLDGNQDGAAGDDYTWDFTTTNDVYLAGSKIENITPAILESNVALDQVISLTFNDILMSSTVTSENIILTNKELSSGDTHEQWFRMESDALTSAGDEVTSSLEVPAKTLVNVPHGVMLESIDGKTYMYGLEVTEGLKNQYQNCYLPAEGPDMNGGECGVSSVAPYCCNGTASTTACVLF